MGIEDELNDEQKALLRKNWNLAMNLSVKFRGQIMEHFSLLEFNMEIAISEYFTSCHPLKSQQLIYSMLSDTYFNFNNRRRLLIFVMKNGYPDFYKQHEKLDGTLQKVSAFRNLIAHRKLDVRPEILLNFDGININLINYTTEDYLIHASVKTLNQEKISEESKIIADASIAVADLGQLIRKT